jgi:hypothetical protein
VPLLPDQRQKLVAESREAAAALLDDLRHFRELLSRTTLTTNDARSISTTLRRLLFNGELQKIAAPRIGRIIYTGPNNDTFYGAATAKPYLFVSGGFFVRGLIILVEQPQDTFTLRFDILPDADFKSVTGISTNTHRTVTLSHERFVRQLVMYFDGHWIRRSEIIKYVANVASGAHSRLPDTEEEKTICKLARAVHLSVGDQPSLLVDPFKLHRPGLPIFEYTLTEINIVLIELMSAAYFLTISADVAKLEEVIQSELGMSSPLAWQPGPSAM